MSETKFTPGPWHCSIEHTVWSEMVKHIIYSGDNPLDGKKEICIIYSCRSYCSETTEINKQFEEQKANAHLIAAAPDLYAALDKLIDEIETLMSDSDAMPYSAFHIICEEGLMPNTKTARAALAKARGEEL